MKDDIWSGMNGVYGDSIENQVGRGIKAEQDMKKQQKEMLDSIQGSNRNSQTSFKRANVEQSIVNTPKEFTYNENKNVKKSESAEKVELTPEEIEQVGQGAAALGIILGAFLVFMLALPFFMIYIGVRSVIKTLKRSVLRFFIYLPCSIVFGILTLFNKNLVSQFLENVFASYADVYSKIFSGIGLTTISSAFSELIVIATFLSLSFLLFSKFIDLLEVAINWLKSENE